MIQIIVAIIAGIVIFALFSNKNKNNIYMENIPIPSNGNGDYDLIITDVKTNQQINVLKEIRAIKNFDLYTAKSAIENLPFTLLKNVDIEYAQEIKERLEASGAIICIEKIEM